MVSAAGKCAALVRVNMDWRNANNRNACEARMTANADRARQQRQQRQQLAQQGSTVVRTAAGPTTAAQPPQPAGPADDSPAANEDTESSATCSEDDAVMELDRQPAGALCVDGAKGNDSEASGSEGDEADEPCTDESCLDEACPLPEEHRSRTGGLWVQHSYDPDRLIIESDLL